MFHDLSKPALAGKGWATGQWEDAVRRFSVLPKQPTKCWADVHTSQQLVWWSLNLFLGDILKRMRRFGCFMPALVNVTIYIIKVWNQRARTWRSGRGIENGQEFFTLENFTTYWSKYKFCSSLLCRNLQRSVIERGDFFGGAWGAGQERLMAC